MVLPSGKFRGGGSVSETKGGKGYCAGMRMMRIRVRPNESLRLTRESVMNATSVTIGRSSFMLSSMLILSQAISVAIMLEKVRLLPVWLNVPDIVLQSVVHRNILPVLSKLM